MAGFPDVRLRFLGCPLTPEESEGYWWLIGGMFSGDHCQCGSRVPQIYKPLCTVWPPPQQSLLVYKPHETNNCNFQPTSLRGVKLEVWLQHHYRSAEVISTIAINPTSSGVTTQLSCLLGAPPQVSDGMFIPPNRVSCFIGYITLLIPYSPVISTNYLPLYPIIDG